jgi:hypothetical protein
VLVASTLSALLLAVHPETPPPPPSVEPTALLSVPPPLLHARQGDDDEARRSEARDHLAGWPALQVMAEVLIVLREAGGSWWAPALLCERWPASDRLRWLEQRADLRAEITRSVTGLSLREPRRRTVAFQAELIDAAADPGSDAARIEAAFDPRDLVVYGPVRELWDEVMRRIPWDAELPPALVERLLAVLLADRSAVLGTTRPPILSAWRLRTAIDTRAWQSHLPARVRAAVDEARLHKELVEPGTPFSAREELVVVTPAVLAVNLPLRALRPVFSAAARLMGLETPAAAQSQPAPKAGFGEVANDADLEITTSTA